MGGGYKLRAITSESTEAFRKKVKLASSSFFSSFFQTSGLLRAGGPKRLGKKVNIASFFPLFFKPQGYYEREDRRMKCGMMAAVDKGLGRVMNALKVTGQMDNTLVIFTSDNGGAADLGSSNHPLRGSKGTMWEGAIHVPTFMYRYNNFVVRTSQA